MFLDFEHKIRTDSAFRDKIYNALETMQKTAKEATKGEKYRKLHEEAIMDYLKASSFNITPLLGYYFPTYPAGTPYSLKDFPFAHCYYTMNLGHNSSTIFRCGRQIGKSLINNTIIKVRNKKTGNVENISISELFDRSKNNKKLYKK